jgi:PPM family protein phosphatase
LTPDIRRFGEDTLFGTLTTATEAPTVLEFGSRSDLGRVRENNEDSVLVAPELNLFAVSDGMGGLAAGELASRITVEAILEYCRRADGDPSLSLAGKSVEGVSKASNRLASAVRLANRAVHAAAAQDPTRRGMGATIVAVRFTDERMSIAHVGDSRAYRLRGEHLEQLTQDHSYIAEQVRRGLLSEQDAAQSNLQNVLIRALGVDPEVEVDIAEELVMEGDTILLCSDGLTRELSDTQIAAVLRGADGAQQAADRLVDFANQAGGGDNITAVVLRQGAKTAGLLGQIGRLGKRFIGSRNSL